MSADNPYREFLKFGAELTIFQAHRDLLSLDASVWERELFPFGCDFHGFGDWMRARWRVAQWDFADGRQKASEPCYNFTIESEVSHGVALGWREIEGLIPERRKALYLKGRMLFVLDFLRAFKESFGLAEFVFFSAGYDSTFLRYSPEADELAFLAAMRERCDPDWRLWPEERM